MLALKLTRTRRVSHVDDLLADPAAALFAGLAVLLKKTALTDDPPALPRPPAAVPGRPSDGTVWAWGDNQNGQLGRKTVTDHE